MKKSNSSIPNFLEALDNVTEMMIGYRGFTRRKCEECDGTGYFEINDYDGFTCGNCKGSGRLG